MDLLVSVATAVGILLAMAGVHRWLYGRSAPSLELLKALQLRTRLPAGLLVLLVPAWWVVQRLPELSAWRDEATYVLYLGTMVFGVEAALALLFDYVLSPCRPLPLFLPAATRLVAYGAVLVYFMTAVLDLGMLGADTLDALGSILLVYLLLHLLYAYLFKAIRWKHPLAVVLRDRLRFWAYLTVLALTLLWAITRFPLLFPEWRLPYQDLGYPVLHALVAIMVLESLFAVFFDYYFPHLRKVVVPNLFRDLTRTVVYLGLGLFAAVSFGLVTQKDLGTLLLGSTVLSVILGLALQETLGNFFAGLALGISKPYNLGDFVTVGPAEGQVEKIDWRSTAIRTNTGDYVVVPNSILAKEVISNYSAPTDLHARYIDVGVHYRHPPNQVKRAILEAAYSVPDVLENPVPEVWLMQYADSSMNYRLRYWMRKYALRYQVDSAVREAIWYRFAREGIEIPFPIRNVLHHRPPPPRDLGPEVRGLLETVDFLKSLTEEELRVLAARARIHLYAAGEKVCVQGEAGSSFYIIKSGRVRALVHNRRGELILSREMEPGAFFGEMALLTGEPRSATVEVVEDAELLCLDKEDLRAILRRNPDADRLICEVLAQRQMSTWMARTSKEEERVAMARRGRGGAERRLEKLSEELLRKIRDFFSY